MKKKNLVLLCLALSGLTLVIHSCRKDPDTSLAPQSIRFALPEGWPAAHYLFEGNTLSQAGFELGRKIFYDTRLSRDNSTSCGSCHQSFAAFANIDHNISHGVDGLVGTRNSPGLANMAWSTTFFWDGGVLNIENQPIAPIENPVEMDLKIDSAVARLNADPVYREQFGTVFGNPNVTSQNMLRALAQFMAAMISDHAKYDRVMRHEAGAAFTAEENAGLAVFQQHCASCHKAPLFTDYSFRNNGLNTTAVNDSGRFRITHDPADWYKFKVPSLRNLGFTKPYMHDGRFRTLDEVLDHYDHGIAASPTLDPLLQGGVPLNAQDRSNLLAFLATLNDSTFVADERFHEPRP